MGPVDPGQRAALIGSTVVRWGILLAVVLGAGVLAPPAAAAPPGFPDLDAFSAADPSQHVQRSKFDTIGFTTPTLTCSWDYIDDPDRHVPVQCHGQLPGLPGAPGMRCGSVYEPARSSADTYVSTLYVFTRSGEATCAPPDGFPRLAAGHKLTATNNTCAVTDDGVACIDPIVNHGFVLWPAGSWVF
ncbi:hypothetical protein [Mycolicibacterium brisbanense]